MSIPIVSVIVPVYNVSQYLDQCLDSLVNQTLRDIEIICINDASTDNSLEILRFWEKKDERIKIINLPENRMVGAVRNIGIKAAVGEYLGFVDSDDYISYDYYQTLIEALNPDIDIVTVKFTKIFNESSEQRISQFNNSVNLDNQESIKKSIAAYGCRLCASIFRRSYFIENKFQFVEGEFFEDNPIVQCMFLLANHIIVVDNKSSFWYYRINPSSIVHCEFSDRKFIDRLHTTKLMLSNFRKYNLAGQYKEEFVYRFFMLFYYNTIYLLMFRRKDYRPDYIRQVYKEYVAIAGSFPENVYLKDVEKLKLYKLIGKYPVLGELYLLYGKFPVLGYVKRTMRKVFK